MTKIIVNEDCGNSPKNKFLERFEIALAKADLRFLSDAVADDIRWTVIGQNGAEGKEPFISAIRAERLSSPIAELTIKHVVSHGKSGAVDGFRKTKLGTTYHFCSVYEFASVKSDQIREITVYQIAQ